MIAPLLDLLRSDSMSMSTSSAELKLQSEICWFFAFLTAKDDATVNTLMTQGLAEVGDSAITFACCALHCHHIRPSTYIPKINKLHSLAV